MAAPTLFIVPERGAPVFAAPAHMQFVRLETIFGPPFYRRSPGIVRRLLQLLFQFEFGMKSLRPIVRFKPDVLVFGVLNLFPAAVVRGLTGCRLVLTLHNQTEVEFITGNRLLVNLLRRLALIFVVSKPMRAALEKAGRGLRITVRPTGVDLARFSPNGAPRRRELITVGSFKWKKGYTHLLQAMRIIADRCPDVSLRIVGEGSERELVERTISELGLNAAVELAGRVDQDELAGLLNESALFVLASLREGLPKALLEALATGTPAVVTTGCNAGDFIGEAGLEVPAGDPEALAGAVLRLLDDQALWQRFSARAPEVARRFSWEAVAKIEQEALEALL
ncbi:MAG TPA: glycosyltransferase [Anaerolineales bacterium]|nr:glycosyltransferase [Anaerolineales bacterium]